MQTQKQIFELIYIGIFDEKSFRFLDHAFLLSKEILDCLGSAICVMGVEEIAPKCNSTYNPCLPTMFQTFKHSSYQHYDKEETS